MQRLAPSLMFVGDQCGNAEQAMELYVSAFEGSRILDVERLPEGEGPQGLRRARFELAGSEILVMDSPGPHQFSFTPAISLTIELDSPEALDAAWERLSGGATVLMPLGAYDFSPRFGWLQDRFGVTWQLNLTTA